MASMAGSVARRGSRRGGLSHYWPAVYPRGHIAISNSQQPARWTLNTSVSAIQNMGVDRRAGIAVLAQNLYGLDIVSIFQQVRGE